MVSRAASGGICLKVSAKASGSGKTLCLRGVFFRLLVSLRKDDEK